MLPLRMGIGILNRRWLLRSVHMFTPILTLAITSDLLPLEKVNDLADTVLAQKLSEVTGVGLVTIEGNQKPAVRVRVNPGAIANYGLSRTSSRPPTA